MDGRIADAAFLRLHSTVAVLCCVDMQMRREVLTLAVKEFNLMRTEESTW